MRSFYLYLSEFSIWCHCCEILISMASFGSLLCWQWIFFFFWEINCIIFFCNWRKMKYNWFGRWERWRLHRGEWLRECVALLIVSMYVSRHLWLINLCYKQWTLECAIMMCCCLTITTAARSQWCEIYQQSNEIHMLIWVLLLCTILHINCQGKRWGNNRIHIIRIS